MIIKGLKEDEMITMADGSQKKVCNLRIGDLVLDENSNMKMVADIMHKPETEISYNQRFGAIERHYKSIDLYLEDR